MAKQASICDVVTKAKAVIVSAREKSESAYLKADAFFQKEEDRLDALIAQFCTDCDDNKKVTKAKKK